MLAKISSQHGEDFIHLGLVHRDSKTWDICEDNGLLNYDFEEAFLNVPLLEDSFNYFVDPEIRYTDASTIAAR